MGKLTCTEFLTLDEVAKPKYVYFATAYVKGGKPEDAVIDVISTEKLVPMIVEDCKHNLNASYYARVKEQYAKEMKNAKTK